MPKKKYRCVPYSPAWERIANARAREFVDITTCVQCGTPTVKGYCCTTCGSTDPSGTSEERQAYYDWCREQEKK